MKFIAMVCTSLFAAFMLSGCFGEDYDVGVPIAQLHIDSVSIPLKEGTVSWHTASENVQKKVKNTEQYAFKQPQTVIPSGQKAFLEFKENEENGGDIWTDPVVTASLLKDGKKTELSVDDSGAFTFPTDKGNYGLEVEFSSSAGTAQYVGNIVIK